MVDYFLPPLKRDGARLPFDAEPSYPLPSVPCSARSRRSSVSSFAESEVSVFSDTSITSSQTSASTHLSSGWESSTPYDSDDETYSSLYEDSSEAEAHLSSGGTSHHHTTHLKKDVIYFAQADKAAPTNKSHPIPGSQKATVDPPHGLYVGFPEQPKPTPRLQRPASTSCHPRRTTVDASWSKPTLITQHERRVNFVENLVDSATQLVALIWPLAMTEVCNPGRQAPVITLRFFIRETLRRSRTSFSTLQVAMYYLALLNYGGQIPKCEGTTNQALYCGRRMFLASLILASKYLQDRNYFTKAWSRISNLSVAEINRNEMALLSALEYKLHIRPCDFQKWTDGISKCTAAVQQGVECPWVGVLMAQHMWRPMMSTAGTANMQSKNNPIGSTSLAGSVACPRPTNVPEHRLELARIGQSVCPTKPFPLPVRACSMGKSNMQWQGMAAHLQPRPPTTVPTNLAQGVSQIFLQEQESPALPDSDRDGGVESQSSLLSPPTTPEAADTTMTGVVGSPQRPPPTPKEPLVSLNTTPDSNDGVSTFGNYLGPPSDHSPSGSDSDNAKRAPVPPSSVARCTADTLDKDEEWGSEAKPEVPALDAGCRSFKSLEPSSPRVERVSSPSSPMDQDVQRRIAAAVRAEFDSSESFMNVVPDNKPSHINTCVQERTRRLLNIKTPAGHCKGSSAVIEEGEADDTSYRSDLKCRRSGKHEKCQRRKRPAGSFSGDHGLSMRTKKVLRS